MMFGCNFGVIANKRGFASIHPFSDDIYWGLPTTNLDKKNILLGEFITQNKL